jgi:hypothetical protein
VKTRIGNAVEGMLQGRAATQANRAFEAGQLPEFVEAQNALGRRIENLDKATSGVTYNTLGAKPGDVSS